MIADLNTVRQLLQITSTSTDALIAELLPVVQRQIVDYCNNRFLNWRVWLTSSDFVFANASPATITDPNSGFVDAHFHDDMDIFVTGSYNNDGFYEVNTVTAGTLTLKSSETLIAEDEDNAVTIYKVDWPQSLKMTFAKMVNYNIQKDALTGIESQRLGDYSVQYTNVGGADYPSGIVNGLKPFKKLKWR